MKMNMKKIMAVLCALLMVCLLAACSGNNNNSNNNQQANNNDGPSAYELYVQSQEKMEALDTAAYDMDIDIALTINAGGQTQTVEMPISANVTMVKKGDNDYDMAMLMNMDMSSIGGGAMQTDMYYTGGYMYYDVKAAGQTEQMKTAMSLDDAEDKISAQGMADLEEDWIKESSVDGNKIHMVIDGTKMTGYLANSVNMGGAVDLEAMTIGDVTMDVTTDNDGMATAVAMNFPLSMSADGVDMTMNMDMTMTLVGTDNVSITFPEGMENWDEVDASELQ